MCLMYFVQDREDTQMEVGQLATVLEAPLKSDLAALKRVARYLKGTRDHVVELRKAEHYEDGIVKLNVYTDSDWADDVTTRRSRSSSHVEADGVHMFGNSSRQSIVAKSSCEAEWYGASKGISDAMGLRTLFTWLGYTVHMYWLCDSSSARALSKKLGIGRIKHLDIHTLWLQELVARGVLEPTVVSTEQNKADLGTKHLGAPRLAFLRHACGIIDPNEMAVDLTTSSVCSIDGMSLAHKLIGLAMQLIGKQEKR